MNIYFSRLAAWITFAFLAASMVAVSSHSTPALPMRLRQQDKDKRSMGDGQVPAIEKS